MWYKISDERLVRKGLQPFRPATDADEADDDTPVLTVRRWVNEDGRFAIHVPGANPELMVLDADGVVLREYDLPGTGTEPNPTDPLRGATEVRAVAATAADDIETPTADPAGDDARWALLRGWA
jgi:hypothetical protein